MYFLPFKDKYPDQDFTPISHVLKEYYPVGKGKRLTSDTVSKSPGFKKMGEIYKKEFIDNKAYNEKWGKLTAHLKKVFKKPVHGYGDLFGGGFVGGVIVQEDKEPEFIRQKSLKFYVSILGPFFAIHGIDSSIALLQIDSHDSDLSTGNFEAKHAITVSPVFEYQEVFKKLEEELRLFFPGFLFVPYTIGMSTMENISVADELRDPRCLDTIYEALFGVQAVHDCLTRGDEHYGMSDWVKSLTAKEKSLINVISQHVLAASKETTIHKVWKLQEAKRLETFKVSGNLMFGMDLFDVIDLTDKSKFIMTSKERGAPSSGKYTIKDEVIEINPSVSLRIVKLSKTSVTLNLILNIQHGNVSVKGEAMELKFVQMKKLK